MPAMRQPTPNPDPGPAGGRLRDLAELEQYEEERSADIEREDIDRWLSLVPKIPSLRPYQALFQAVTNYFEETDIDRDDLHQWQAYKEVIMQRYTGVYDQILALTDIIVQDLFRFLVEHERLKGVHTRWPRKAVPLTFLGRSEDYYYTYTGDRKLPITVVSIPHSRIGSAWNWLAIPHEVGHHALAYFPGYEEELLETVAQALRPLRVKTTIHHFPFKATGKGLLASVWFYWLEETIADIYGILFTGPAQVMARQGDACSFGVPGGAPNATLWDVQTGGMSRYPTCYVRCLFQSEVLRALGFHGWADRLDERWIRHWGPHEELEWYDDNPQGLGGRTLLFTMPVSELLRSFRVILPAIMQRPYVALGGNRLVDLIRFDADDEERALRIARGLQDGEMEFGRKDRARHILAASRIAFEENPDAQVEIHNAAVEALKNTVQWVK
ncbi:MAG TPA: hypothetical protein VEI97_02950 [bacterium]|nr:hypothetical protein [bacterium]